MRRVGLVLPVLLVAATLGGAGTANAAPFTRGTIEVTPSFGFAHNSFSVSGADAGSTSNFTAIGELGYFLTDNFELGGGLLVDYQSVSIPGFGSDSGTSLGLIAGVQYNFNSTSSLVPFVRGALGIATNSGDLAAGDQTTLIAPALAAGMRALVGNSASVNFAVDYQHRTDALGVQDLSANTFGIDVGVSIFLRRGR